MLHVSERTDWEAWRAVWGGVIRQGAAQCALAARLASAAKGLQGLRVRGVGWNRRYEISMNEKWVGDSVGLSFPPFDVRSMGAEVKRIRVCED